MLLAKPKRSKTMSKMKVFEKDTSATILNIFIDTVEVGQLYEIDNGKIVVLYKNSADSDKEQENE